MDYKIFNVRTFLCVRIRTGVVHTDSESAQHIDSKKTLECEPGCFSIVLVGQTVFQEMIRHHSWPSAALESWVVDQTFWQEMVHNNNNNNNNNNE